MEHTLLSAHPLTHPFFKDVYHSCAVTTVQNYLHGNPSSLDYCVALKRQKSTLILQPVRGLLECATRGLWAGSSMGAPKSGEFFTTCFTHLPKTTGFREKPET